MTAMGPHAGGMQGGLEGRELEGALSVCTLQQEMAGEVTGALTQDRGPEVSMSCRPLIALSHFVSPKLMSQDFTLGLFWRVSRGDVCIITN